MKSVVLCSRLILCMCCWISKNFIEEKLFKISQRIRQNGKSCLLTTISVSLNLLRQTVGVCGSPQNIWSQSTQLYSFVFSLLLRWFKDGQEVKEGVKYNILFEDPDICALVIRNITGNDAGTYTCKAFNKFGEAFDSAKVTFLCKLKLTFL